MEKRSVRVWIGIGLVIAAVMFLCTMVAIEVGTRNSYREPPRIGSPVFPAKDFPVFSSREKPSSFATLESGSRLLVLDIQEMASDERWSLYLQGEWVWIKVRVEDDGVEFECWGRWYVY